MTQQIIPQSSSIGSTIDESSFSGLLTLVEIGHIRIRLAGNGRINRIALLAEPPGVIARRENDRHTVMDVGDQLVAIGGDDSKGPNPFARSRWPFYRPGDASKKEGAHRPGAVAVDLCNGLPITERFKINPDPISKDGATRHQFSPTGETVTYTAQAAELWITDGTSLTPAAEVLEHTFQWWRKFLDEMSTS